MNELRTLLTSLYGLNSPGTIICRVEFGQTTSWENYSRDIVYAYSSC